MMDRFKFTVSVWQKPNEELQEWCGHECQMLRLIWGIKKNAKAIGPRA